MKAILPALILLAAGVLPAGAALNAYLELKINGTAIDGEPTQVEMGGVDVSGMIECHATEHEIYTADTSRVGAKHGAFKIVKRIDRATPLIAQALARGERVDAVLRYFRNNPDDGATEEFFKITLQVGRIVSARTWSPNNLDPASAALPPLEEIQIVYQTIDFERIGETQTSISNPDGGR